VFSAQSVHRLPEETAATASEYPELNHHVSRRAFITGVAGQDGSYLAEFLLGRDYEVAGLVRHTTDVARSHIAGIADKLKLHRGDLADHAAVQAVVAASSPDEIYHLAAQSHVAEAERDPGNTLRQNVLGTLHLLEAARKQSTPPRFFHASTAQIFGQPDQEPQDESTPVRPMNLYGVSKALATRLVQTWRSDLGLFAVNGILFNHESPRRGSEFVTAKICKAAAAIRAGRQKELHLGDITTLRDWGDAREFVQGFWRALQAPRPDDYVFATGQLHSVEQLLDLAFGAVQLNWRDFVRTDPTLFRRAEAKRMVGNPAKAARELGWIPQKPFAELIREMVAAAS